MACGCTHHSGVSGRVCHGPAELLLLSSADGDLEGSEEEDGMLSYIVERKERFHAPDKVCAGQRELLRGRMEWACFIFY